MLAVLPSEARISARRRAPAPRRANSVVAAPSPLPAPEPRMGPGCPRIRAAGAVPDGGVRGQPPPDKRRGCPRIRAACAVPGGEREGRSLPRAERAAALELAPRAPCPTGSVRGAVSRGQDARLPSNPRRVRRARRGRGGRSPPQRRKSGAGGRAGAARSARSSGMGAWGALRGILAFGAKQPPTGKTRTLPSKATPRAPDGRRTGSARRRIGLRGPPRPPTRRGARSDPRTGRGGGR